MSPSAERRVDILGGGPAGLAAALHAQRADLPFRVYEASAEVGGNCRTLRWDALRYDTGAHRVHDRDPDATREIRRLLGDDLLRVDAPSHIVWRGRRIRFPLEPLDLARTLGPAALGRAGVDLLRARVAAAAAGRNGATAEPAHFQQMALDAYGRSLAETFLLGYTRKLWGTDPRRLSPRVSGGRLRGLDLRGVLAQAVGRGGSRHLDGTFWYPRQGIGMLFDRLADTLGREHLRCRTRVTQVLHDGRRVQAVVLDDGLRVDADQVVSTLPVSVLLGALRPQPPERLLWLARSIRFRHLLLGVFHLGRDRLTPSASLYFPGDEPFTRLYEPKNRSAEMAPPGHTAVVLEVPCDLGDELWEAGEDQLQERLAGALTATGLVRPDELLDFRSHRVPFAYPVLELDTAARLREITRYLDRLENLHLAGRSARFEYSHIHDMFRMGQEAIQGVLRSRSGARDVRFRPGPVLTGEAA